MAHTMLDDLGMIASPLRLLNVALIFALSAAAGVASAAPTPNVDFRVKGSVPAGSTIEARPNRTGSGYTARVVAPNGTPLDNVKVEASSKSFPNAVTAGRAGGVSRRTLRVPAKSSPTAAGRFDVEVETTMETVDPRQSPVLKAASRPGIRLLRNIVGQDPALRREMKGVLADRENLIDNVGQNNQLRLDERAMWVPLAANPELRRLTVRSLLHAENQRSDRLKAAIRTSNNSADLPLFDTVVIGAGPTSADIASTIGKLDPNHTTLVIEAGEAVSSNFSRIGSQVSMNSANRQETGKPPARRTGNRNPTSGPVGIPDMSGEFFPPVETFADDATLSLVTSGANTLFGSRVERGAVSQDPNGYAITARDVRTGDTYTVRARNVVFSTGLGKPSIPLQDDASRAVVQAEFNQVNYATPARVPKIVSYSDALALAKLSPNPRDPYRKTEDGRVPSVALIGAGDSGKTFIEFLQGDAKGDAYKGLGKNDSAQRGEVGPVDWVVGQNGIKDCKQYLDKARPRYAGVSRSLNGGQVKPVALQLTKVEQISERIGTVDVPRYKLTFNDNSSKVYDRVVVATGFENQTSEIIQNVAPSYGNGNAPLEDNPLASEVVKGTNGQAIAKRVNTYGNGSSSIYLAGPAAGSKPQTALVQQGEIEGVKENVGSRYALIERNRGLASILVGSAAGKNAPESTRQLLNQIDTNKRASLYSPINQSRGAELAIPIDAQRVGEVPYLPSYTDNQWLKFQLASMLDKFTFGGTDKVSLQFKVKNVGGVPTLSLKGQTVAGDVTIALVKEIASDTSLVRTLLGRYSNTRTGTATVEVPVRDKLVKGRGEALLGTCDFSQMKLIE